jgi:hypothetical protein
VDSRADLDDVEKRIYKSHSICLWFKVLENMQCHINRVLKRLLLSWIVPHLRKVRRMNACMAFSAFFTSETSERFAIEFFTCVYNSVLVYICAT